MANRPKSSARTDIAVIGMSCWYPGARNLIQNWENILAKRRQFRRILDSRLPLSDYYDPKKTTPDKTYGKVACYIDGFEFDRVGKRIPKSAYDSTDIAHWLALDVAVKAVEDAALNLKTMATSAMGVVVGNSLTGEWSRSNSLRMRWPYVARALRASAQKRGLSPSQTQEFEATMEAIFKSVFPPVTEDSLAGNLSNTIAGRIANFLDIGGGGYTVDGACSSSLIAVSTAANHLATRQMDTVIAGGVDISLDTVELIGFAKVGALAEKDMRVYDSSAAGFFPGEGSAFVILKRLEDAIRDGNRIYAVLKGWGVSSDGKGGITAPTMIGQSIALERAYKMAGYDLSACSFIEGHGTGTSVGDKIEIEGVALTMSHCPKAKPRQCGMTSFKSIVGHTKAAAGVGAFIKTAIALNRRVIPPVAGTDTPNSVFDNGERYLYPVLLGEVKSPDEIMRAGVSAMGFGGINCHVTLESYGKPFQSLATALPERTLLASYEDTEVFILAANSLDKLKVQIGELQEESRHISEAELVDLAAELSRKNNAEAKYRAAIIAHGAEQLNKRLGVLLEMLKGSLPDGQVVEDAEKTVWIGNSVQKKRVGFLFPGQGSQKLNMSRQIVERFDWAQDVLEQSKEWLAKSPAKNLQDLLFRPLDQAIDSQEVEGWSAELAQTNIAQPAICLASMLWLKRLNKLGIFPTAVGGHSLGELTSFHCAGAIDEQELLTLASLRGSLMSASAENAGTMASLTCDLKAAEELVASASKYVVIANINAPNQIVVSGTKEGVEEIVKKAQEKGLSCQKLNVSNAFHSKLVADASSRLESSAKLPQHPREFTTKLFTCMDGKPVSASVELNTHFASQILHQVDFVSLVKSMAKECDLFIEVGPGQVLSNLVSKIVGPNGPQTLPVEARPGQSASFKKMLAVAYTHGVNFNWDAVYANRLVRPYISPMTRVFLDNPCERPFPAELVQANAMPTPVQQTVVPIRPELAPLIYAAPPTPEPAHAPVPPPAPIAPAVNSEHLIFKMVAERTGFAIETLSPAMRLLEDLNLDSIKSGELVATIAREFGLTGDVDPSRYANATLGEIIKLIPPDKIAQHSPAPSPAVPPVTLAVAPILAPVPPPVVAPASEAPQIGGKDILFNLIEEMTSFPQATLTLQHRLLDDLNLDSIKAGELVAKFAAQMGREGKVDPSQFANATLQQLIEAVGGQTPVRVSPEPSPTTPATTTENRDPILDLVLENARRISGFSTAAVQPDLHLAHQLGMSQHHIWEIFNQSARQLSITSGLDRDAILNSAKTLQTMAGILKNLLAAKPTAEVNANFASSWVRDFAVEYRKLPRIPSPPEQTVRTADKWNNARVAVLVESEEAQFADELAKEIRRRRGTVDIFRYGSSEASDLKNYSHIFAVLNSQSNETDSAETRLKKAVARLQTVARVPSADLGTRRYTTFCFIQFTGGMFGDGTKAVDYDHGCAKAFAASLSMERQDRIRIIDLPHLTDNSQLLANLVDEINTSEIYKAVGFNSQGERLIPVPVMQRPREYSDRPIKWNKQDVVLVTGGARGITAECALAFAKHTGASLALVGSTSLTDSDHKKVAEIQKNLERFKTEGINAKYYACDTSQPSAVDQLVASAEKELGSITAVIHGAGLNKPRPAMGVSAEDAYRETSIKVLSAVHLCEKLKNNNIKMMVGFTSIIGVTGMPGNAWYGFSNEALHLILRRFRAQKPDCHLISVAFSVWDEVGMGARMGSVKVLAKKGIWAIPPTDGTKHFIDLVMKDPGHDQVIVAARLAGLPTWSPEQFTAQGLRFIEKIHSGIPGVELYARTRLTIERDKYLSDHNYNGSLLFPTVFGLEAMAQAAACMSGMRDIPYFEFQNVLLERPIVADPKSGVEIEIYAEMMDERVDGCRKCKVGIRAEQTGFKKDHFSATLVFGSKPNAASGKENIGTPLDIRPLTDLYGPYLFQGPLFQRLENVYSLSSNETVCSLKIQSAADIARNLGTDFEHMQLGDAFYRDSLLQSGQAVVLQDCLPIRIENWKIYPQNATATKRFAKTVLTNQNDKSLFFNVEAWNDRNQLIESLAVYELRKLGVRPNAPTSSEFAAPDDRDTRLCQATLLKACDDFGLNAPAVSILNYVDLGRVPKGKRHDIEAVEITKLATRLLNGSGMPKDFGVEWENSGKPRIRGDLSDQLTPSISHDERACLFVIGDGAQGCDMQPIENRDAGVWHDMMGEAGKEPLKAILETENIHKAATRVWTVIEAVKKASEHAVTAIEIKSSRAGTYLFKATAGGQSYNVLSFPLLLTRGSERMVAFVVHSKAAHKHSLAPAPEAPAPVEYKMNSDEIYRLKSIEKSRVLVLRAPITFREVRTVSQNVHFSTYFEWIGKIRELAVFPITNVMAKYFNSGEWAAITNDVQLNIFDEISLGHLSDCYFWQSTLTGPEKNIATLNWDWRKAGPDGTSTRVATAVMRTCWARVVSHGVAKSHSWPEELGKIIEGMSIDYTPPPPTQDTNKINLGAKLFHLPQDPVKRIPLKEHTLLTTLEESNVVTNIYFANYEKWMGQVFDYHFHAVAPQAYDRSWGGELICNSLKIQHMRDAMPFDTIQIRMSLRSVYERGFGIYFEFYRQVPNGSERLAHAEFEVVWAKIGSPTRTAVVLPETLKNYLLSLVGEAEKSRVPA